MLYFVDGVPSFEISTHYPDCMIVVKVKWGPTFSMDYIGGEVVILTVDHYITHDDLVTMTMIIDMLEGMSNR